MSDLAFARRIVAAFSPADEAQAKARDEILAFVDAHPDALHRSCAEGHLTGSALIVDESRSRVLLMFHRKLQMWLQMGGHADGHGDLRAVALREATEESGIAGLDVSKDPIDVDVHLVRPPSEPPHLHLDVRYLAVAPVQAEARGNTESVELRWFDQQDFARLSADESTVRLVSAVLRAPREGTGGSSKPAGDV